MLDTVILQIPREQVVLLSGAPYVSWTLQKGSEEFKKYVRNQTASQKADGIYRPRVAFTQRGRYKLVKIEFSAPKLLFGNNLDEVEEKDFGKIVGILKERLMDFGIKATKKSIRNAPVSSFHPSKNIELGDRYTSSFVIKELGKINLNRKLDFTHFKFGNDGSSLQYYSNSHSLVIYDKVEDLRKPEKRAVDKEQTPKQRSLFEVLDKNKEILRIEVRLSKKRKMNSIISGLGRKKDPTFSDIFKKELCQKIIQQYWNGFIADKHKFLFDIDNQPQRSFGSITNAYPKKKLKEIIYLVGLKLLAQDKEGIGKLRKLVESRFTRRTWYRISKDLALLNEVPKMRLHSWFSQVVNSVEKFEPIKLSTLDVKKSKV